MISHRSLSTSGLALAAILTLVSSSCLHSRHSQQQHTLAVKAEGQMTPTRSEARRSRASEHEYFEGSAPPAMPTALAEQRPSAPSPAHVWIAGHHTRRDGQWVWVGGHYALPPRPDVVWVSGHWVDHLRGYAWIPGAWR